MNYEVLTISVFEKQSKKLKKKYVSLKEDLLKLVLLLKTNPEFGTSIGKNCFKIRLAITSKNKGKSGGARVVTNFVISDNKIYLLTIYDKSERDNITDAELDELLSSVPQ